VSRHAATVAELLSQWQGSPPAGKDLGPLEELLIDRAYERTAAVRLLAPFDLQCIKACGVTFAISAVERVIEERARGNAEQAHSIRSALSQRVGADIRSV
jgi:fumarylacetoacetate (FAA) hydrolase family protein